MAKLYLKNEIFTVSGSDTGTNINGSTEVYGTTWGFGTSTAGAAFQGEDVRLSETAKNVKIDANIEKIEFTGQLSDYRFYYQNSIGTQGTLSYVPAHLQITNNSLNQSVSIASINQPVNLLFSEGYYTLTQVDRSSFSLTGSQGAGINIPQSPAQSQVSTWSDNIAPFNTEKSTIQPTVKPSNITLPFTHTNAVVQVESGHNIRVNNFKQGDALDLFPNASISVVPDSGSALTFKLNDGNNNETTVSLNGTEVSSVYNLSSFLTNYKIISHIDLNNFSTNTNINVSGASSNIFFNINGNSSINDIIGSNNSDTIDGGGGLDNITGGLGADTINSYNGTGLHIFQNTGDSPLTNSGILYVDTSNLDVINGLSNGNVNSTIFLSQYTSGVGVSATQTDYALYNGVITPVSGGESSFKPLVESIDLSESMNTSTNDNRIYAISGIYDAANHRFTQQNSGNHPDKLVVYDGKALLGESNVSLEAIVLVGYDLPINLAQQPDQGAALNLAMSPQTTINVTTSTPETSSNAGLGNFEFNFANDTNYTFTISNFSTGDKLRFPGAGTISFPDNAVNTIFNDNTIELDWTQGNNTIKVILTGLTSSIDSALPSIGVFNTAFPGNNLS